MRMRRIRWAVALALLLTLVCSAAMAATYTTLKNGDTGDAVKQMQVALNALGYSTNGADGKFGTGTENAVRLFQKANGLKQDGKAGTQTLTLLYQQYDSLQNGGTSGSTGGSSSGGSTSGSSLFGGNYATLEYGSRGDRVKTLQTALNQLGYSAGSADGKFGAGTQKAVTAFQKANGLTADGKAGRITLQKIESLMSGASASTPTPPPASSTAPDSGSSSATGMPTRTLRKGYTGDDVKSLQTRLKALGYYTGSVDGKYGSGTVAAVKAFQKAAGLKQDGIAGPATCKALFTADTSSGSGSSSGSSGGGSSSDTSSGSGNSGYTVPTRTLRKGYTGDDVLTVQTRLKELGYYTGILDGSYGTGTIAAVKDFQSKHGLTADGIAGPQTFTVLFSANAQSASSGSSSGTDSGASDAPAGNQPTADPPAGGWTTLRRGDTGEQVVQLQNALAILGYPVGVSGTKEYDYTTVWAVECFQRRNGLNADGVAGAQTLAKIYGGAAVAAKGTLSTTVAKGAAPDGGNVELLHWFNDIKSYLQSNRTFTVYDPATGLSWQMRLYSAGNHADSEPLTQADSDIMYKAWGNQWSWNEKPVYIKLANSTWCIASMPNMPHLSGSISNNGFNGHTCVHFPRTMTEVQKNDPKNGGRHQRDIRLQWRKLTGEDIPW
ncbi:MAG: peptidoglycan-binding protein [Eubacteriales bacterium]|nr:peptidoglycan-binding protein [Eubacteriales bacterium]